jgi:hypothetical protein
MACRGKKKTAKAAEFFTEFPLSYTGIIRIRFKGFGIMLYPFSVLANSPSVVLPESQQAEYPNESTGTMAIMAGLDAAFGFGQAGHFAGALSRPCGEEFKDALHFISGCY